MIQGGENKGTHDQCSQTLKIKSKERAKEGARLFCIQFKIVLIRSIFESNPKNSILDSPYLVHFERRQKRGPNEEKKRKWQKAGQKEGFEGARAKKGALRAPIQRRGRLATLT